MKKDLNTKLLAEALVALDNNDIAKATRLFQHHWNMAAKNSFALLEADEADFDMEDEDFASEVSDEVMDDASSSEEKFDQLQLAVDELEDKFPAEMTEETQAKFDDLRNKIDEIKLGGDEESDEDCSIIIEDLKADFEVAGEMSEDVTTLFDEIESGLCGGDMASDEVDVSDDELDDMADMVSDEEDSEETVEEAEDIDVDFDAEEDVDGLAEKEETDEVDVEVPVEYEGEDESEDLDIIYDAKKQAEELLAKLDELESSEKAEEGEAVEECWTNVKLPRNKLQSEEEGVKKQGMKLAKSNMSLKSGNQMGVSNSNTAGKSANTSLKKQGYENKGAKSWTKVEKPANKAADGKSPLGK